MKRSKSYCRDCKYCIAIVVDEIDFEILNCELGINVNLNVVKCSRKKK